jgi:hypothetical protein
VRGTKLRALHFPGKSSSTELNPQPCIYFMVRDVFISHLGFFLWELYGHLMAHTFIGLLIPWKFRFWSSLYILVINPKSDV